MFIRFLTKFYCNSQLEDLTFKGQMHCFSMQIVMNKYFLNSEKI